MATLPTLLQPNVVLERISRLKVENTTFQTVLGIGRGGPGTRQTPGGARTGAYDIFSDTREVSDARLPGAVSGTVAPNPVGVVHYTLPRIAEKMPLLMEKVHGLRRIGGPVGEVDVAGQQYVADQERIMAQRIANVREFQAAAMCRGSYTYTQTGDRLIHAFSGGTITVNYRIAAANKSKLNMIGGGDILGTSWDNAASPIVSDLRQIHAAFIQLCGLGLTDVICDSTVWGYVLANTQAQAQAGTVNRIILEETRLDSETFVARIAAAPWITWHINDQGVNLNGTFTALIDNTHAVFLARPSTEVHQVYECGEPVIEYEGRPAVVRFGEHYWIRPMADPASYNLHNLYNGLPALKIPTAVAYGLVKY